MASAWIFSWCRCASYSDKGPTLGNLSGLLLCHSLQLVKIPSGSSEGVLRLENANLSCTGEMENVQLSLFIKVAMSTVPVPCVQMGGIQPRAGVGGGAEQLVPLASRFIMYCQQASSYLRLAAWLSGLSSAEACRWARENGNRVWKLLKVVWRSGFWKAAQCVRRTCHRKSESKLSIRLGPIVLLLSFPLLHTRVCVCV